MTVDDVGVVAHADSKIEPKIAALKANLLFMFSPFCSEVLQHSVDDNDQRRCIKSAALFYCCVKKCR